ncbi:hypothetical protein RRG08_055407 [Elysia crispata]|uniref:Uncharacterized protein n=1 Tax=Elysia crispata TaxID=231223 RepID=A0AAE1AQK8_9GAST|nr:hypothetical protein RRG08_055407 [Elysia crispata]
MKGKEHEKYELTTWPVPEALCHEEASCWTRLTQADITSYLEMLVDVKGEQSMFLSVSARSGVACSGKMDNGILYLQTSSCTDESEQPSSVNDALLQSGLRSRTMEKRVVNLDC